MRRPYPTWPETAHAILECGHIQNVGATDILHRRVYLVTRGKTLPSHMYVCHSCDVKLCCNPEHLWEGTANQNIQDFADKGLHHEVRKTHCKRGHPLSGDNVRMDKQWKTPGHLRRTCRACERARYRRKVA